MANGTKGRILLIEDDSDLVQLIAFRLRRRDYEVAVAFDGSEGYFAALRERPDLILLDLLLPGFTGTELLHLLRTNPDIARVPIIVISALDARTGGSPTEVRGDAYLRKPFDLDLLVRKVERTLDSRSELHREARAFS